jgi:4-hydroxy-3-methylbut-2-en-1-yl diphosphate reductase
MVIEIDPYSGFCFGVKKAVEKAEELTASGEGVICLGEIVHNHEEVERLDRMGMKTIHNDSLQNLKNKTVLIRTHGEPPSTYKLLNANNNNIIDATCPVVLKLQQRIKTDYDKAQLKNTQIVIFGKANHPEVISLNGQTNNNAIIVSEVADLDKIDFAKPITLYSQTTMPLEQFHAITEEIKKRAAQQPLVHDTICRQVANRAPRIRAFAAKYDVVLFVSGKNSSNGKLLFAESLKTNPKTYFISNTDEVNEAWFSHAGSVGICGATSTPFWLMENVKGHVSRILNILS